jgi:S-formylglutathione hydrolase FrmB
MAKLMIIAALATLAATLSAAVSDPETWTWNDPREYTIPGLQHQTFASAAMKRTVGFCIYLPPQYEREPERRFPVAYFLHGSGGTESSDAGLAGNVHAAVVAGVIPPIIYVFPNGGKQSGYRDWEDGRVMSETLIIKELIPHVDAHFRTRPEAQSRAVCGFSMGGGGAIRFALKYPDLFGTAGSFAAALDKAPDAHNGDNVYVHAGTYPAERKTALRLLLVVGEDDSLKAVQVPFLQCLKDNGIAYTFTVHAQVGHDLGKYNQLSADDLVRHLSRQLEGMQKKP